MRFTWKEAKTNTNTNTTTSSEGWGMGFLLVLFPEESPILNNNNNTKNAFKTPTTAINALFKSSKSPNIILNKAQSTISICAFLIFLTLLLFTLSSFEPTTSISPNSRRHLSSSSSPPNLHPPLKHKSWSLQFLNPNFHYNPKAPKSNHPYALQGMGTLFRRGTKSMNSLIVAHITEFTTPPDIRLFLRLFHRSTSNLTSKSDLLFIFPSNYSQFHSIIHQEIESHSKITHQKSNTTTRSSIKEKETGEPIWGKRVRTNYSEENPTRFTYGSVLGFEADELDPENSLAGFLDGGRVPMSLRRWACYPMLLGRLRRNFKHVMLVNLKEMLILGDPFTPVVNKSPESVYLSTVITENIKHGKKKSHNQKSADPGMVVGGARGVRRLSNAMLTEIVRVAMQRKKKSSLAESALLNQVVGNGFVLKNIHLITSSEPVADVGASTGELGLGSGSSSSLVRRGNSNLDVTLSILKHICSIELHSSFYGDC